ncbi:hypothetical protein, partial [Cohnella xylanilytica]|uniref:hypothetical protein n=1 Tax=Cohnella xylanilytica TaxID=557555 RepID=UPI001C8812F7
LIRGLNSNTEKFGIQSPKMRRESSQYRKIRYSEPEDAPRVVPIPKNSAFRARRRAASRPNTEKFGIQSPKTRRESSQYRKIRYSEPEDSPRVLPIPKNSAFRARRRAATHPNGEKFAIQSPKTRRDAPNSENSPFAKPAGSHARAFFYISLTFFYHSRKSPVID